MAKQDLTAELYYSGSWHTVAAYTRDPALINRERPVGTEPCPSSVSLTLQGIYNPKDPLSALYGVAGQNTPLRLKLGTDVRFYGEVASWAPQRAIKGDSWTAVTVNGVLRRLGQGADPLRSALERLYTANPPTSFWSLNEGTLSSAAAITSGTGGSFRERLGSSFLGVAEVSSWIGSGMSMSRGDVTSIVSAPVTANPTSRIVLDTTFSWDSLGQFINIIIGSDESGTLSIPHWRAAVFGDGVLGWGNEASAIGSVGNDFSGVHHIRLDAAQSGADATLTVYVDGVAQATYTDTTYTLADYTHVVYQYSGNVDPAINSVIVLSSVALYVDTTPPAVADAYAASQGYPGEQAHDRMERLCDEEGIPVTIEGSESQPMGPQPREKLVTLFAEIEKTDDGLIFEPRDAYGLLYRTGRERRNRTAVLALDYALKQVAPPLQPVLDDLASRNDVTAKRRNGSDARAVKSTGALSVLAPPNGIGRYTTQVDVNTETDEVLTDHASWWLHKFTIDGIRYERVTVDLDAAPTVATDAAAVDIGDVITIDNLPVDETQAQVRLHVTGYSESIESHHRLITYSCIPAATFDTAKWGSDALGSRYGARNTVLAEDLTAVESGADVTATGETWITTASHPSRFPFKVTIGGLNYTCTAITGTTPNYTLTLVRLGNDKTHATGAAVTVTKTGRYGL